MAETIKIGGELESTATGNVVAAASAIKDKVKNKYQGEINAETDATLAQHTSAIQGLNSQNYETYAATNQTTAVTDVLPATGEADTVYRVGNWDGSQFDASVYSEYAWNGSQYVHLSTKTQTGEVFDISAYHATGGTLATYADLSAALDSNNGGGVPQSLQKGGMSVKYVQSSDNKYVQYFLTKDEWSLSEADWQKMNLEEDVSQLEAKVDDLNKAVDGTEIIFENAFIGGYTISGSSWNKDTSNRRVGITPFTLSQGDTIKIDGAHCKMNIGYKDENDVYGSSGFVTTDFLAPVDGIYIITLEGVPSFVLSDTSELTRYVSFIRSNSQVARNHMAVVELGKEVSEIDEKAGKIYPDFAMFSDNLCDVRNGAWVQNTYKWELTGIPVTEGDTIYLRGSFDQPIRTAVETYTGRADRSYNPTAYVGFLNASGTQISQINMLIGDIRLVVNQASGVVPSGAVTAKITISNNVGNLPVYLLKDNWKSVHLYVGTKPRVYEYDIPYPSTMLDTEKTLNTFDAIRLETESKVGLVKSGNLIDFTNKDDWSHRSLNNRTENKYLLQSKMFRFPGGQVLHIYQGGGAREYAKFLLDNGLTSLTLYIEEFDQYGKRTKSSGVSISTGAGHTSVTLRSDTEFLAFLINNASSVELNIEDFARWSKYLTLYVGLADMERGYAVAPYWEKSNGVPSYWNSTLDGKIETIKQKDGIIGEHGVSFAFITDPHYPNNARVSPFILREIYKRTSVNMLVNGGDIINGSTKDLALLDLRAWMDDFKEFVPFVIKGNHDMNTNGAPAGNEFTDGEWYAICVKQIESQINEPKPYFYIDNNAQKVRFIFLDTKDAAIVIDDAQISWMESRITELQAGWSAIVFAHKVYTDENTMDASGTKIINSLNGIYDGLSATLVGVISGHTHKDFVKVSAKGYPIVVTTCDSCPQNGTINGVLRQMGTTTECAWDVMHIDTDARKIYATRIGAGSDREITY